jgi:phosphoribosylformylglycinamidine (FGAM) synthase PurS component
LKFIEIQRNNQIETAIKNNLDYICNETLTNTLVFVEKINNFGIAVDVDETLSTFISVQKN